MAPLAPLTELHTLELSHNRLQALANPAPNPYPNRLQAVWLTLPLPLTLSLTATVVQAVACASLV